MILTFQHPISYQKIQNNLKSTRGIYCRDVQVPIYSADNGWSGIILDHHHILTTQMCREIFTLDEINNFVNFNSAAEARNFLKKFQSEIKKFLCHVERYVSFEIVKGDENIQRAVEQNIDNFASQYERELQRREGRYSVYREILLVRGDFYCSFPLVDDEIQKEFVVKSREAIPELHLLQEEISPYFFEKGKLKKEVFNKIMGGEKVNLIKFDYANYTNPEEGFEAYRNSNNIILKKYIDEEWYNTITIPADYESFNSFVTKERIVDYRVQA